MESNKQNMNLIKILESAATKKIAVIGDFIEDIYLNGTADRLSPEVPVPVLLNPVKTSAAGGAGNVYMNLCNLGVVTHLYCNARIEGDPNDPYQKSILQHPFGEAYVNHNTHAIKTRMMTGSHHILRQDDELVSEEIEWLTFAQFSWWKQLQDKFGTYDCIVFSDYGKGVVSDSLINGVMELALHYKIPVIVDCKCDFLRYKGATLMKCNNKEWNARDKNQSTDAIPNWVVTMGGSGMIYFNLNDTSGQMVKGLPINIVDVCGAGDTVTAILALAIACGEQMYDACELANIAAAEVCKRPGVYAITKEDLISTQL